MGKMNPDGRDLSTSSRRSRWYAAFAVGGMLGLLALWYAASQAKLDIVEYPMLDAKDIPAVIAAGKDGSVWFTIDYAAAIGRVYEGKVQRIAKPTVSLVPVGLAVAADGAAWYADSNAREIARITPEGRITAVALGMPLARLGKVAIAPDGGVWFAEATAYSISRVKHGKLERHVIDSVRGGPYGVAVAPDGVVWATLQGANQLLRIALDGKMTTFDIPTRGSSPTDIEVAGDGAVWFTEFRGNKIGRFAQGRFEEWPVGDDNAGLTGLGIAHDGAVWFGLLRKGSLGRLRDGKLKEFKLPRERARPYSVAVDKTGNVWYTDLSGYVGMLKADDARK